MTPKKLVKQRYFKFLAGNLKCNYIGKECYYPAPTPNYNDKGEVASWTPGEWVTVPDAPVDGEACGVGLHLMKVLNPLYGRYSGNCYEAEGKDLCGQDNNKARFKSVRLLKPVQTNKIFKPKADLSRANLSRADLSGANLSEANLSEANLYGANLYGANLYGANLYGANLSGANLYEADLSEANLYGANLSRARLIEGALSPEQTKMIVTPDGDLIIEKAEA